MFAVLFDEVGVSAGVVIFNLGLEMERAAGNQKVSMVFIDITEHTRGL